MAQTTVGTKTEAGEKRALVCQCGCGAATNNRFAQGHDARHKSNLLRRFDEGDRTAGAELVQRGWKSQADLDQRAAAAGAKAEAKATRITSQGPVRAKEDAK